MNKNNDLAERIFHTLDFFSVVVSEIYHGIKRNRIPAHKFCVPGMVLALLMLMKIDVATLGIFNFKPLLPHTLRMSIEIFFVLSGWIIWGLHRAIQRNRLLSKLKSAFEECKWKCSGKYPSLIEDAEIDNNLRKLRLKSNGVTLSEYEQSREKFEHMLNISVVKFLQPEDDKNLVDVLYTTRDLTRSATLENPDNFVDGDIPVGISHEGPVKINFRDVGHILVSGQTGGGKSNFLKLITSILSSNNEEAKVLFLDFKGGMESADLKNQIGNMRNNISFFEGTHDCAAELRSLGETFDARLNCFKDLRVSNIDEYLKKTRLHNLRQNVDRAVVHEKKTFVIIDEITQLYAKSSGLEKELVEKARAAVNRIARQGRAAGIYLICATQKPDAANFDQTVKANLPAALCFPMANQASSVSALGTKRAYELNPNIKGRAVWKFGPEMREVQTYLFT